MMFTDLEIDPFVIVYGIFSVSCDERVYLFMLV